MISDENRGRIVSMLQGQNYTETEVCEAIGIELEDVEDIMLDEGFDRCPVCDYWFEAGEFIEQDGGGVYYCPSCDKSPKDSE